MHGGVYVRSGVRDSEQSSLGHGIFCLHQVLHRLGIHTDLGLEELALGWVTHSLIHTYCWFKNRAFPGKQLSLCGEFFQELTNGSVLSNPQEKER